MTNQNHRYVPDRLGRLGQGTWIDGPAPFGRLQQPGQEKPFDLSKPFALGKAVGVGGGNVRADVAKIETLLGLAGVMDLKETDGPTGYAGQRLVDGIRDFQKQNGLAVDGRAGPDGPTLKGLSQSLQSMGRNGDTVLAHLTPEEAQVLHNITDGGSINPKTGLLEFWNDGPSENGGGRNGTASAGRSGSNGRGTSNTETIGEHMKATHNAREARMAARGNQGTGGDGLEPFGGSGPDIPSPGLLADPSTPPEPEKTNLDRLRDTLARKAVKEEINKSPLTGKSPAQPNTFKGPKDKPATKDKTPANPHSWGLEKPRPTISQQVNAAKKMAKKGLKDDEDSTTIVGGPLFDEFKDRWSNPKNNQWSSPKARTMTAEEGKKVAKEIGAIVGLEAIGVGLKAQSVATKGPYGTVLGMLGNALTDLADHLKDKNGYKR